MMKNVAELERIVRYYIDHAPSPDMRTYGKGFLDHFARGLHSTKQMMRLGKMHSARVLDLGCGFGWHALMVSLLGDNEVVANDVRALMIRNIEERIGAVREQFGVRPRLQTLCGDFVELDIPNASYDAIFCNQTIEHIHDLDACFRKAHEVLKPGGTFVIANDNNCLVRKHLSEMERMWIKRDTSWQFIDQLKQERPQENRDIKPYAIMREEIIRKQFPQLSKEAVGKLVHAAAGQIEPDILGSVRGFLANGTLPQRPQRSWCRNPVTGEYCERQFDPFEVKEWLRNAGFRVRLLQDIRRGGPLRLLTKLDVPVINQFLFRRRARYVLAARKTI